MAEPAVHSRTQSTTAQEAITHETQPDYLD